MGGVGQECDAGAWECGVLTIWGFFAFGECEKRRKD